ncbi:MAG: gamma-glutamyl-gamma-aminobutyrate hydrolase family protein [Alphaproteobacteria bacterium]|nr:gamma-glutamyl-gamma-aminobutyrate hydrolase family protein [Alphaproteobacteria bacterium]
MAQHKPLIGILLDSEESGTFSPHPYYALRKDYFVAVEQTNAIPCGIHYSNTYLAEDFDRFDGYIIPGGDYTFPESWYASKTKSPHPPNNNRLSFECGFLEKCLNSHKPFLAICSGMQVLGAITGGKITSDLPKNPINHRPEKSINKNLHNIDIKKESLLHKAVKQTSIDINTHHSEALVSVGNACYVSAHATDGVIEAIEVKNHPFALGVQWHPESMPNNPHSINIFKAFVQAIHSSTAQK